jgi:hypothetical protein
MRVPNQIPVMGRCAEPLKSLFAMRCRRSKWKLP